MSYQPDYFNTATQTWEKPNDQFIHKYHYDAENRLLSADVSTDDIHWEDRIANYQYYQHGPVAKITLGQQQVQSITCAYTLQGWIKGIVPGNDANTAIARQAFNYSLHYFNGDYTAINGTPFSQVTAGNFVNLYNGNIGAMAVDLPRLGSRVLHAYKYDQLNRIKEVNNYTWNGAAWQATEEHKERLTFDPNGNILAASLNGNSSQLNAENFSYTYDAVKPNRLLSIYNSVNNTTYNYSYDEAGNVTKDELEGNSNLQWNIYGKLLKITKTGGAAIDYTYDANGNRISRKVTIGASTKHTFYVRDASGNILATYIKQSEINNNKLTLEANNLYGSSLLGRWKQMKDIETTPLQGALSIFTRGQQELYVNNHLGNNLLVLSDRKLQHSTNSADVDYYDADILSATDYSAYGENLIGREYNSSLISYGFNGKLNDADAGYQDYGMRVYSVKARRFPSVDPLMQDYPWYTPYQFAGNKTINSNDLDGLEENNRTTYVHKSFPVLVLNNPNQQQRQPAHNLYFSSYNPSSYEKLQKENAQKQRQFRQDLANATMDPLAAQMLYPMANFVKQTVHGTLDNGFQVYDGIRERNYTKAGIGLGLLLVDIPFKGVGKAGRQLISSFGVNVFKREVVQEFAGVTGVYIHEFTSGTVYVGQAKNLAERPLASLKELTDITGKYKGTAAKAGDTYSGTTKFIPLEGSGFANLNELEAGVLNSFGGTMKQGGSTFNIRRISGN